MITLLHYTFGTQLSKYAMTDAHEASAAREPIGIAEKWQQYFDICDYQCHAFLEFVFILI